MSKEKQIEEMAKIIANHKGFGCNNEDCCDISCQVYCCGCLPYEFAEVLYNAGFRKQSEWISVEERLPEENTRVLVYLGKAPEHHATKTDTDRIYRGTWVRWSGSITHWMPLPEAPEGDSYVDAGYVKVVRCKDCRFCKKHPTSDKMKMCTNEQQWVSDCYPLVYDNDFCSYGERKCNNDKLI